MKNGKWLEAPSTTLKILEKRMNQTFTSYHPQALSQ
jgi:hypothetical protein